MVQKLSISSYHQKDPVSRSRLTDILMLLHNYVTSKLGKSNTSTFYFYKAIINWTNIIKFPDITGGNKINGQKKKTNQIW